jgi:signal transduction histidine kinase
VQPSMTPRGVDPSANLTVFKKGLLLVAIPLLAQLLFLGILLKMRYDQLDAQRLALHSKEVIAQTEAAFRSLMQARSSVRSLALTGDTTFAQPPGQAQQQSLSLLKGLRDRVSDNPPQQAKVERMRDQAEQALTQLDGIRLLARRPETREQALAALRKPQTLHLLDDVRATIDDFLAEEERLDEQRRLTLKSTTLEQNWMLAAGGLLAVLSTLALAFLFSRGIGQRLSVLMDNVRRLAAGEELAAPLTGRDELSQLDRVFHEMADTLRQKDRENEMFVYSVSHDLRSPLVNLQGFSQELALVCEDLRRIVTDSDVSPAVRQRVVGLIDRDAGESIQFIQTAVRRLAAIIDALLRLSRVGRVVYQWQQVEVRAAVDRVVKALSNTIAHKGAHVVVGDLPPAWGDPTAVEQIFANLLGNAVNYLDPGRPGKIEVGVLPAVGNDGLRTYYVKDNGLGIAEEHLSKVFLAFQRLHPNAAPGEGIGLPLVRRMVERHSGRIWVESVAGQGSTFFVSLPTHALNGIAGDGEGATRVSQQGERASWQRSLST